MCGLFSVRQLSHSGLTSLWISLCDSNPIYPSPCFSLVVLSRRHCAFFVPAAAASERLDVASAPADRTVDQTDG